MSSDKGKSKSVFRGGIQSSGGSRSMSTSPGPSHQSQPGRTMSTSTQPNTDMQLASIHGNQTSIHGLIQQIKDAHDVMRKEKWSYTDCHGQKVYVAERIGRVLESFEECAKIIDVEIQHHPDITALVWAGARFILMVVRNGIRFMDDLETAIATTVEKMAACEYYAQIYHECLKVRLESAMTTKAFEVGLDSALKELYTSVHAFLNKAMEYIDPGNSAVKKAIKHLKPFSVTMQPLIQAIGDKEKKVKEYADMATMERIKGDSSKLQEIQCVMGNIRIQMEPLAKLDDIFNVTKEVRDNFVEFQTEVVQALHQQQSGILSYTPLDMELQNLKDQYMAESQDTSVFEASLYVSAQGMNHPHAPEDEHFDLATRVRDFLAQDSPEKVCLIQGVAGSGKSTFNHYLATELWDAYCKADVDEKSSTSIPVFIPLANVFKPSHHNQDLIADFFKQRSYWSDEVILRARRQLRFVFILDGYDEIENRDRNFYISNRLADWKAKTVITSRPEYLGEGYRKGFIPSGQVQLLREYWIAPFSITAMREYINKYAKSRYINTTAPKVEEYEQLLQRPELRSLISNPFLLRMVLTVDPRIITDETDFKRGTLYQAFLTHWLEQGHERLLRVQLPPNLREAFTTLRERSFTRKAKRFCLDFAVELYRHRVLQIEYDDDAPSVWDRFLTDSDSQKRLLRYSLPLTRVGQASYRFIHKSLRDFAIAQAIWQDDKFHTADALINEFHIVDDSGVIDFVVEEAEHDPTLQQALLDCVNRSKVGVQFTQAASNAITILVRTRWRFNGSDLRGIRVCGADISSGWFDGAQLQKADLREVRARGVWLRGAALTGARMDGVWFGEKPCFRPNLKADERIYTSTCCYSVDGELLVAVVVFEKNITESAIEVQVWSVSSRQLLHSFKGDKDWVLAFAPDGRLLASACRGGTIRLYGLHQSHQKLRIFKGDFDHLPSLAFSVDGQFLALASKYKPVLLLSTESGNIIHTFTFPCYSMSIVYSMSFSPDGKLFAFGGYDLPTCVWSMEDYSPVHTFGSHQRLYDVEAIAFSPDSQVLATWDNKRYFQLWSLPRKELIDTLCDHKVKDIRNMCYSPDSQMIATVGRDNIVRLWSVAARKVLHEFDDELYWIAFSPDGQLLAGCAADGSVRQWAILQQLGNSPLNTGPTTGYISGLAFWSDNKVLISASVSDTVMWDQSVSVRLCPLVTSATTTYVDVKVPRTIPVIELQAFDAEGEPISAEQDIPLALSSAFIIGGFRSGYALWSFEDNKPKYIYYHIGGEVNCVAISTDGELLACVSVDLVGSSCASEDLDDSSCASEDLDDSSCASEDLDDSSCASEDWLPPSGCLKLIKCQTGELVHEFGGYYFADSVMEFSHDGQVIAVGDLGVVQFLSVPERRLLHTIEGYDGPGLYPWDTFDVTFSPDDQMVAFSGKDATIRLWSTSMPNFKHLNTFEGHTARITSIVFSPDGDIIVSGSHDRTLRFWSVRSMKYLFYIDTRREIRTLAWRTDPGSEDLAVGTEDSVLQLWRVRKKADYTPENPSVEVSCHWSSRVGLLNAPQLQIQGVTGLDEENLELLKQLGAVGEPAGEDGRISEIIEVEVTRGRKRGWTEQAE